MAMELPDNIRDKMIALQAMALKGTQHEAETASAKLAKLLQRYGLENPPKPGEYEKYGTIEFPMDSTSWRKSALGAAAIASGTKVVFEVGKAHLVGTEPNIELTKYVYAVFERTINNLATQQRPDRAFRNSFRTGAAQGLRMKVSEARKEADAETTATDSKALIIQRDGDLQAALRRAFPRLRAMKVGSGSSRAGYDAGFEAGKGIAVNPGVAAGSGVRRLA